MGNRSVVVGLSGGVDSSVAALKLVEAGFDVKGVFLCMWEKGCEQAFERVVGLGKVIGIPVEMVDVRKEFTDLVIKRSAEFLKMGMTPNPCIWCNQMIKFKTLLARGEMVATGHYARIGKDGDRYILKKGRDRQKEQSYFLYMLSKRDLPRILFPLGDLLKDGVREISLRLGISKRVASESQDLCFANDMGRILKRFGITFSSGKIIDTSGKFLGWHKGLPFYTVGQRRGLSLGGGPFYVVAKDMRTNTLVVGSREECLFKGAVVGDLNWIEDVDFPVDADVKIRYVSKPVAATVEKINKAVFVHFHELQFAVTPGQSAVFYAHERVLGGGIIYKAIR